MPYKVSFFGDRQAETLPDKGGQELYNDYQQGELPEMVELRSGLTVQRRTIKEIEYVRAETARVVHTREGLKQFENDKLKPFLSESGGLTEEGELKFLESEGFIRVDWEVFKKCHPAAITVIGHMAGEYQKMQEKLSQWRLLQGKRNYAKKMETKELEAMAAGMNVNK